MKKIDLDELLKAIEEKPLISQKELAAKLGFRAASIVNFINVNQLIENQVISRTATYRNTRYSMYEKPEADQCVSVVNKAFSIARKSA